MKPTHDPPVGPHPVPKVDLRYPATSAAGTIGNVRTAIQPSQIMNILKFFFKSTPREVLLGRPFDILMYPG